MSAVVYCRLSSKSQNNNKDISDEKNIPIEFQESICQKYCDDHNITINKVVFEISSGRVLNKQTKLMSLIRQLKTRIKFDYFLVSDVSRLTRDASAGVKLLSDLKNIKIKFFSVGDQTGYETIHEQFNVRSLLNLAQYETDKISERVKRSIEERRKIGSFIGVAPFGKIAYKDNETGIRKLNVNRYEQIIIDIINCLIHRNMHYYEIANYLNDLNIACRKKDWTSSRVKTIFIHNNKQNRNRKLTNLDKLIDSLSKITI